jgi:iron complex outermembrane receptor protein
MNQLATMLPLCGLAAALSAQTDPGPQDPPPTVEAELDLTELSLEQLMEVPVEVAARHRESVLTTAASVFVLNEPEIRRSGLRSVPELLRLVPGLIIAQDVPGAYGFGSRLGEPSFAGMLVLLDGQRLYTTLLRREYWQAIDVPVENIERIEVVRGPGGARWGDKASQGVINIVTKKAADAQGVRVTAAGGTEERAIAGFRYGDALGEDTHFYVYSRFAERDGGHPTTAGDRWTNSRIGMRADSKLSERVGITLDGEYHDSYLGDSYIVAAGDPSYSSHNQIKGGHAKALVHYDSPDGHRTELRVGLDAYDQDIRDHEADANVYHLRWREELFTTTLQQTWRLGADHSLTLGAAIRHLTVERLSVFSNNGREYNESRGDAFAAWDWSLCPEFRLTIGGNLGYQDGLNTTGVDVQPDARLAWMPDPALTIWAGVSANEEPDTRYRDSGLFVTRKSNNTIAYELGLRRRWGERFLLQVDTFLYELDDQIADETTDPGSGATLYQSDAATTAFGGEVTATWNVVDGVRLSGYVATTQADSRGFAESFLGSTREDIENEVPRTRGAFTLGWEPVPGLELDSNVLYTERHAGIGTWWRVDLRAAWRLHDRTTVEVVGQNLTDPDHVEYYYEEAIQRGVYAMVTHRF